MVLDPSAMGTSITSAAPPAGSGVTTSRQAGCPVVV